MNLHNNKIKIVKERVKNAKELTITTDFWISIGNESYCGITGHWITNDWELKSIVLECIHFNNRHYADNIASFYMNFAEKWNFTNKVQAIVTENARNMVSAINKTNFVHIPCLAHSL